MEVYIRDRMAMSSILHCVTVVFLNATIIFIVTASRDGLHPRPLGRGISPRIHKN